MHMKIFKLYDIIYIILDVVVNTFLLSVHNGICIFSNFSFDLNEK